MKACQVASTNFDHMHMGNLRRLSCAIVSLSIRGRWGSAGSPAAWSNPHKAL